MTWEENFDNELATLPLELSSMTAESGAVKSTKPGIVDELGG
jgi:hypothetical protein